MPDTARLETIVVAIVGRSAMGPLFDAMRTRQPILGMQVNIMALGDQVTVPGEIMEELAAMDWNSLDRDKIRSLIERAEKHLNGD